jgi:hypothetical protein
MQGDFDDLLKWPLKAKMKVVLVNQQPLYYRDHELYIELKCSSLRLLRDKANAVNCGGSSLGSIALEPYLRNGCLHIRVVSIQF